MFTRILVWGAGAIGGTVAAFLKRAGHPVVVVDADPEHVEAVQSAGLTITGPVSEFNVACEAFLPSQVKGEFDLVLLAVKAQHTATATAMLRPHLSAGATVVSLQNGLNEPVIAGLIGAERTLGCFVHFGADYIAPGKIAYVSRSMLMLGELDGCMSERLKAVHAVLRDFEPGAGTTDNIFGFLWSKLAFGALLVGQTLSNRPTEQFLDDMAYRPMIHRAVGEVASVAHAEGVALCTIQGFDAASFLTNDTAAMDLAVDRYADSRRGSKKLYSGVWRDLAIRRRPTEISHWYAPVLEAAQRHGIAMPVLAASVQMIASVESGERPLSGELAGELMSLVRSLEQSRDAAA